MQIEIIIQIAALVITALLFMVLIPKNKIRQAHVAFLFKQVLTWIFGLMVAEFRLIEYPVRLFAHATRASFTFEYFVYPGICAFFNIFYPEDKNFFRQLVHYIIYCSGITIFEVILLSYTDIIKYTNWTWYWTWITLFVTFYISRKYYVWFFSTDDKKNKAL